MAIEIEGRILNIDPEETKAKLLAIGAKPLGFYNFRRYVFDPAVGAPHRWLRLRTDGDKTTLTFKELTNDSFTGTEEWEIEVSDFETTLLILEKTGIKYRSYQENTRDEYEYQGTKLSIDHWPKLGYLLEIEVEKEDDIREIADRLGFKPQDVVSTDYSELYRNIGIDINNCEFLKF
ncbi:MAG: class IV adenylate cyclase [Candidatus Nanosyncoccus sp.]